jgi:hypothetical protein
MSDIDDDPESDSEKKTQLKRNIHNPTEEGLI